MKMLTLFLFVTVAINFSSCAQSKTEPFKSVNKAVKKLVDHSSEKVNPELVKRLKQVRLRENQYIDFSISGKDTFNVVNILLDNQMLNKDSLCKVSDNLYYQIWKAGGKYLKDIVVQMMFVGKTDDQFNFGFSYQNLDRLGLFEYKAHPNNIPSDSIVTSRLNDPRIKGFARSQLTENGKIILFTVPLNKLEQLTEKEVAFTLLDILINCVRETYVEYNRFECQYINRYNNYQCFTVGTTPEKLISNSIKGIYGDAIKKLVLDIVEPGSITSVMYK